MPESKYCAIGIYPAGQTDPQLMAANGKVILFDTLAIAQNVLPILGCGRFSLWSQDHETISWAPLDPQGINRADILTGYDPYHLPAGMPGHLRSEAHGREWKHHVLWAHWLTDCGQFEQQPDGTYINTALGPPAAPGPVSSRPEALAAAA